MVGGNNIHINGKELDTDQLIAFRDSCIALQDNYAFKALTDQIRYLASNLGMYKAISLDEIFFYKAALWIINQYNVLLEKVIDVKK